MSDRPLRCTSCGHTDFYVVSNGVAYRGGTIIETYRWPEQRDELDDDSSEIEEAIGPHVHDRGYTVEQEILREPDIESVEGPVRAFCAACLADMTEIYLRLGRGESLPV